MPSKERADLASLELAALKDRRRWFQITQDEYEQGEIILRLRGARDEVDVGTTVAPRYSPDIVASIIDSLSRRYESGELSEDEFVREVTPWALGHHTRGGA